MSEVKLTRRGLLAIAAGMGANIAAPALVRAASYATQPIRLYVGTAAAGSNDLVARLIAPVFKDVLGQPVIVENRPGGATTLAASLVAKAKPDGHTLLVSSSAAISFHVTNVNKPVHLIEDLSHVGMACDGFYLYAIHKDVPAQNVQQFITLLKQEPGTIRYGATGAGGSVHLSGEMFCLSSGTKMTAVQYTNAGMRANELLSNQTQLGIAGAAVIGQHIRSGQLRGLMVAGGRRDPLFPELPNAVDIGMRGLENITNWFAVHGPKGMPEDIIQQLNSILRKAMATPEVVQGLSASGLFPATGTPQALIDRMTTDYKVMSDVAKRANIQVS